MRERSDSSFEVVINSKQRLLDSLLAILVHDDVRNGGCAKERRASDVVASIARLALDLDMLTSKAYGAEVLNAISLYVNGKILDEVIGVVLDLHCFASELKLGIDASIFEVSYELIFLAGLERL